MAMTKEQRQQYIEETAKRYAENVRQCLAEGWQPMDRRHLSEDYWRQELEKAV